MKFILSYVSAKTGESVKWFKIYRGGDKKHWYSKKFGTSFTVEYLNGDMAISQIIHIAKFELLEGNFKSFTLEKE